MNFTKLLVPSILVGIAVAFVYYVFETAVSEAIELVWIDWFNTEEQWFLVIPVSFLLAFIYFGAQHLFDPESEKQTTKGLGSEPKPTFSNLAKVLGIGFLSLFAGASLGPEAVLVPASTIIGAMVGLTFISNNKASVKTLGIAGFSALFAAFFSSMFAGLLGLLLALKESKAKLTRNVFLSATFASLSTVAVLELIDSRSFVRTPAHNWDFEFSHVIFLVALGLAGYALTYAVKYLLFGFDNFRSSIKNQEWWGKAFVTAAGLSALYIMGGHLVRFTGNESITPMLSEATLLGTIGLIWIAVIKILAICWSKSMGYRGGLIFPTVLVASVFVAIVQIYVDISFIYGLLAVLAGLFVSNRKLEVLF